MLSRIAPQKMVALRPILSARVPARREVMRAPISRIATTVPI